MSGLRALTLAGLLRVALLGATLGSAMDALHTFSGTTAYAHPVLWRAAWWTPLVFAGAYVAMAVVYSAVLGDEAADGPRTKRILGVSGFTLLYVVSAFAPVTNLAKAELLVFGALLTFVLVDASVPALATALVAAFTGPFIESRLVAAGLFSHANPDVGGIPLWLPALYLASGPGLSGWLCAVARGSRALR